MNDANIQDFRGYCRPAGVFDAHPETATGAGVSAERGDRPAAEKQPKPTGRFSIYNPFMDFVASGITWPEYGVWTMLWRDTRNGVARTSQSYLAKRLGVSLATVKRAVKRLRKAGLLEVVRQGGSRGRGMSIYRLLCPASAIGDLAVSSQDDRKGHSCDPRQGPYGHTNKGHSCDPLPRIHPEVIAPSGAIAPAVQSTEESVCVVTSCSADHRRHDDERSTQGNQA